MSDSQTDKVASGVPRLLASAALMLWLEADSDEPEDNWHPSPDGSHEVSTGGQG